MLSIHNDIRDITKGSLERRIAEAREAGASVIIFDMDTPGGLVSTTIEINDLIRNLVDIKTVAWVNPDAYSGGSAIAIACDEIVMARSSRIGDAQVIFGGPGGVEAIPEALKPKVNTPVIDEFLTSAALNGYSEVLCEAFIIPEREVWWLENVETGERIRIDIDQHGLVRLLDDPTGNDTLSGLFSTLNGFSIQLGNGVQSGDALRLPNDVLIRLGLPVADTSGRGGRTFAEDIEFLELQHDLAIARGDHERAADFKNQIEILKKQQDFTFKINRLDALDNLTTTILGLQQQARTSGIEAIGRDPFRGAIQAQGGTAIGRSPFERLRKEQLDFAAAEIPSAGANASTAEVQAAIDEAQGLIREIP
ncbi:MAG: hypothetical protein IIB99_13030, partial [Planctomycetes bacterium]|nr:hypothetical protein [Planctomycetota bacterium]